MLSSISCAHDNLTFFDMPSSSKESSKAENYVEIHRRLTWKPSWSWPPRTPLSHSGQEYGRTKQFLDPAYKTLFLKIRFQTSLTCYVTKDGKPFVYPYFIHDSYDSSVMLSTSLTGPRLQMAKHILKMSRVVTTWKDWSSLRQSTDAFRLKSLKISKERVHLITVPGQNGVGKKTWSSATKLLPKRRCLRCLCQWMKKSREFNLGLLLLTLRNAEVLADETKQDQLENPKPSRSRMDWKGLKLNALTAIVLQLVSRRRHRRSSCGRKTRIWSFWFGSWTQNKVKLKT